MNTTHTSTYKMTRFLLVLISVLALIYTTMVAIAPIRKMNELKKMVQADSVFYSKNEPILQDKSLFELVKSKAEKEAQLFLAKKDTFGILVDLNDSTLSLMYKGINVHRAKIYDYQLDQFFKAMHPLVYAKIFSKPLRTQLEYSTIVKEPIIVKKAPKNEEEAIANAFQPDTIIQSPAYMRLELEYNINLHMVQKEFTSEEEKEVEKQYKGDIRKRKNADIVRNFTHLKNASYTPNLILFLNADELRSAYRAIPEDALVIFKY